MPADGRDGVPICTNPDDLGKMGLKPIETELTDSDRINPSIEVNAGLFKQALMMSMATPVGMDGNIFYKSSEWVLSRLSYLDLSISSDPIRPRTCNHGIVYS
jgi:hypothetical protein